MSTLELVLAEEAAIPDVGMILDGKYRIDGKLGKGGMAVVLAATHLQLEQRVAIKLLLPECAGNPELAARIGLESGRVVVDHSGEVYGEAPNVAARVQSAAAPGEI